MAEALIGWIYSPNRTVRRVRLTRKLALAINGFDLSDIRVGDVILVPERVALMLVAEGWAEAVPEPVPETFPPRPARTDPS